MVDLFDISGQVGVITGGSGLLGRKHAEAILLGNGIPVLLSRTESKLHQVKDELQRKYQKEVVVFAVDITNREELEKVKKTLISEYGRIDILINNAANNPKVETASENMKAIRFTEFPLELWYADINVGLTGALNCCQIFGEQMEMQNKGVILNISSDYGILAPDQRLYQIDGAPMDQQPVKPVTYSVIKHGIIGLTKYLATYWGAKGIRTNVLCPSGIYDGQEDEFLRRFVQNVPMGRMSRPHEYVGTILYMISDASSFMNGATVVIDGGKSIW